MWRPAARIVRFVIVCHPHPTPATKTCRWGPRHRGTIFLLSTDLTLAPLEILMLYAYRFKIELGFRQGVHVLGAYAYQGRKSFRTYVPAVAVCGASIL